VKSAPVYFYVQRSSEFAILNTPIPFTVARVNEGNAMNLATGKFTAPRNGIYFFAFTAEVNFPADSSSYVDLYIGIYLNGVKVGSGENEDANTVSNQNEQVTLQSTLNLKIGDQVWVQIWRMSSGAGLVDGSDHYTHFTGFMLQEEIVASL
jgi:hypothetical protein